MKNISFLLVSEGVSDYEVLQLVFNEVGGKLGLNIRLELISPAIDATSKERERGGWGKVKAWCMRNGVNQAASAQTQSDYDLLKGAGFVPELIDRCQNRACWPTLVTMSGADGLLIHLDADIADRIEGLPTRFVQSGLTRKDYCKEALRAWLGTPEQRDLRFVIATICLETWYLATHDRETDPDRFENAIQNYEEIENPVSLLRELGYRIFTDHETGMISIDKKALTTEHAEQLTKNLDKAKTRCPELSRTIDFIESFANN
jgi:hypothetical protein